MRILVVGTGVIGTTYAWQLSGVDCELTHLVRKGNKAFFEKEGIMIECVDTRGGSKKVIKTVYHPKFIDEIEQGHKYDIILVSVGSNQFVPVLEMLKGKSGEADILFLQNIRPNEEKVIAKYINPLKYLFGYPFKAGGGKEGNKISSVIFGNSLTNTMLGEKDGANTRRLDEIFQIFKKANMNPKKTNKILPYIHSHYVWASAILGAYAKAGSYESFVSDRKILKEAYIAMREAFETCKADGIRPDHIAPTSYYYLPLFLLVPFSMKLFNSEEMRRMFEGHVASSPDEMREMYYDILHQGEIHGIYMPVYEGFRSYIDRYLTEK